jgi:mercuric ion transport protein
MGWKEHSMAESTQGRGALFAGGLAATLASTCCLGPLVLITLGFSGAWIANLTALEPYRPIFLGAALVALFETSTDNCFTGQALSDDFR